MTFDTSTLWMNPETLSALSWWALVIGGVFLFVCVIGVFVSVELDEFTRGVVRFLVLLSLAGLGCLSFFFFVGAPGARDDRAEAHASLGAAIQERYGIELADNVLDKLTQGRGQNSMAEGGEAMMREMAGTADIVLDGEDVTVGLAWAGDQWRLVEGSDVRSAEYPLADAVEEDQS